MALLKALISPFLLATLVGLFFFRKSIAIILMPDVQSAILTYFLIGLVVFVVVYIMTRGRVVKAFNVALVFVIFYNLYGKVYGHMLGQAVFRVERHVLLALLLLLAVGVSWLVGNVSPDAGLDDIIIIKKLKSTRLFQWLGERRAQYVLLVVFFPIIINIAVVGGFLNSDPKLLYSGLGVETHPGILPGVPTIDPNVGFSTDALGYRAALDLLQGHIPWWNPYNGVGLPLAGEMQPAALFPLTLILALPGGTLWFQILLEVIAGLATFFLLRQLGFDDWLALVGALLYEVNGTFTWLANAPINPIPFLPLLLLGLERARMQAQRGWAGGWIWLTIALALSLYAGFPEVAYLNGLLAGCWFILRFVGGRTWKERRAFLGKVVLGGLGGLLLAAPIVIAFADFTSLATLGRHAGTFGKQILTIIALPQLALPYLWGPIFSYRGSGTEIAWSSIGGYAGVGLMVLAITGLLGSREAGLRRLLGGWVVISLCATFGMPVIHDLVMAIPGMSMIAIFRYLPPSWELATCMLAVYGIEDMRCLGWKVILSRLAIGSGVVVAITTAGFLVSLKLWHTLWETSGYYHDWFLGSLFVVVLVIVGLLVAGRIEIPGRRMAWIAGLVVLEAALYFCIPIGAHSTGGRLESGGVSFLQQNLGFQRFYTLGPIAPNYSAYFGIASINFNYNPIPQQWVDYIADHLNAHQQNPNHFTGLDPKSDVELRDNLANYEAVGVKYVVAWSFKSEPFLTQVVYSDQVMTIYELPNPAPYVSASGCTLGTISRTDFVANCSSPSMLTRLEENMAGWRAEVNGKPMAILPYGEIFQQIALPEGRSVVHFSFVPAHMQVGVLLFGMGWIILIFGFVLAAKERKKLRHSVR